ncbi:MAG: LytTR family DNA-binding domain-containing protein [Weeksellaceae bacterium]|nr:LytTR family DNA-binding domain-containing protein [Weeksellaceae bacterium]
MKIKALIVDDEKTARDVLKYYLQQYCPQVEIVGEASNVRQAAPLIRELQPQLVFLDVEMPFGNAFDLLEATQDCDYQTIFITAFSEYSLKALNMSAAYYILKPISIDELITAVQKVQEHLEKEETLNRNKILIQNLTQNPETQQLILPTQSGFDVVKLADVTYLMADGNFTQVHMNDGTKHLVCRFLKHFDDLLSFPFVRVHRSYMINVQYVRAYQKGNGGTAILQNKVEIDISAPYKENFLSKFQG